MNVNNGRGLGRPQLQITELENDKTAERQAQEMVAKAEEDAAKAMQLERKSAADAAEEMKVELDAALAAKQEVDEESRKRLFEVRGARSRVPHYTCTRTWCVRESA